MKNNKGFSLVELIIVIAIMAILVGVMAPQLIKYIEKGKVSSDAQLADTVHTAMVTAMMDPEIVNMKDSGIPTNSQSGLLTSLTAGKSYTSAVMETLGVSALTQVNSSLKSNGASNISFQVINGNTISVWIPGTDSRGSKSTGATYNIQVK